MAKTRDELQTLLEILLGSRNVYFQPPESFKLKYPCIVYTLSDVLPDYADDEVYLTHKGYTVTVIDEDPDSEIPDKVLGLRHCKFTRHFTSDNLNHDVFMLYF